MRISNLGTEETGLSFSIKNCTILEMKRKAFSLVRHLLREEGKLQLGSLKLFLCEWILLSASAEAWNRIRKCTLWEGGVQSCNRLVPDDNF